MRFLLLLLSSLSPVACHIANCSSPSPLRIFDFSTGFVDFSNNENASTTRPVETTLAGVRFDGADGGNEVALSVGLLPYNSQVGIELKMQIHKDIPPTGVEYIFQAVSPRAVPTDADYPHKAVDQLLSCRFTREANEYFLECLAALAGNPRRAWTARLPITHFPLATVLSLEVADRPSTSWSTFRMIAFGKMVISGATTDPYEVNSESLLNLTLGRGAACSPDGNCGAFNGYLQTFVADGDPENGPLVSAYSTVCVARQVDTPAPTPAPTSVAVPSSSPTGTVDPTTTLSTTAFSSPSTPPPPTSTNGDMSSVSTADDDADSGDTLLTLLAVAGSIYVVAAIVGCLAAWQRDGPRRSRREARSPRASERRRPRPSTRSHDVDSHYVPVVLDAEAGGGKYYPTSEGPASDYRPVTEGGGSEYRASSDVSLPAANAVVSDYTAVELPATRVHGYATALSTNYTTMSDSRKSGLADDKDATLYEVTAFGPHEE